MRIGRLLLSGLHEPNETRLGFTRGRVAGRGVGAGLADDLYESLAASEAVRADGIIEELEDTALLIPGVGVDLVSDITTNIVRRKLIEFTQETADKVRRCRCWTASTRAGSGPATQASG